MISPEIERLIQILARMPGLGPRSARRMVLHLLRRREQALVPLTKALQEAQEKIVTCSLCHSIDTCNPCSICRDAGRDDTLLIVVEHVSDIWALERSQAIKGRYHVLGGVLSALDGVGPEQLAISSLLTRAAELSVREVLLALNATIDGQTTAHYLTTRLSSLPVKVTRLAHGVPVGGELDYLDEGTLSAAIRSRTVL
jgi:recombination protein RecR